MTANLEHEFFTKVKGWKLINPQPDNPSYTPLHWLDANKELKWVAREDYNLPPISTSWDAFHEWVVPELVKKEADPDDDWSWSNYHPWMTLGRHLFEDKTPQRALEWAMEELECLE